MTTLSSAPRTVLYKQSNRPDQDCTSYFNLRRAQSAEMVFHQSSNDAFIFVRQYAGKRVGQMFERNPPTSIEPEATPDERIDLRMSSQPDVPHTEDVKGEKSRHIPCLTKQVFNSPNEPMLVADLIKNYSRKQTEHVEYYPVSHDDSETHAEQNGNLERLEVSKIEDRVQRQTCLDIPETKRNISCGCGRMLHGITEKVKKQAEQRNSSRYMMYVPGTDDSVLKKTQRGQRYGKTQQSQKLAGAKRLLGLHAQAQLRNADLPFLSVTGKQHPRLGHPVTSLLTFFCVFTRRCLAGCSVPTQTHKPRKWRRQKGNSRHQQKHS